MIPASRTLIKTLIIGLLGVTGLAPRASGDIFFGVQSSKDYLQTSRFNIDFRGGQFQAILRDGIFFYDPACHPVPVGYPFLIPPNPLCPLGTTGFVAEGDVDGDGIRDALQFWSIVEVIPALLFEPFRPDLTALIVAPPSTLPRPLGPFRDLSVVIFYNLFEPQVRQYDIVLYEFIKPYAAGQAGRALMRSDIVLGNYIYQFPVLNSPTQTQTIAVNVTPIPEGANYASSELYPETAFQFTSGTYDGLGNYLIDPRILTEVSWTGITSANTFASDQYRLTIRSTVDESIVLFPPSGVPLSLDLFNDVLNDQAYLMPTGFFAPGDTGILQLRLDRFTGTTAVAFDTSVRLFNVALRYVDTYAGFRQTGFPVSSPGAATSAGTDFDGDGFSNAEEWAQGSSATDPLITPDTLGTVVEGVVIPGDTFVTFTFTKDPNKIATYGFRVSSDGGLTFRTVTATDPDFTVTTNDATSIVITANRSTTDGAPILPGAFVARLAVTPGDI